jgi:hypothetical protein
MALMINGLARRTVSFGGTEFVEKEDFRPITLLTDAFFTLATDEKMTIPIAEFDGPIQLMYRVLDIDSDYQYPIYGGFFMSETDNTNIKDYYMWNSPAVYKPMIFTNDQLVQGVTLQATDYISLKSSTYALTNEYLYTVKKNGGALDFSVVGTTKHLGWGRYRPNSGSYLILAVYAVVGIL